MKKTTILYATGVALLLAAAPPAAMASGSGEKDSAAYTGFAKPSPARPDGLINSPWPSDDNNWLSSPGTGTPMDDDTPGREPERADPADQTGGSQRGDNFWRSRP